MNKSYIVAPIVMMAAFGVVFWQHQKDSAVKLAEVARAEAAAKTAAEAKKQEAIEKTRQEAAKRAEARAAEEAAKEAEKRAKWEAAGRKLAEEIAANEKLAATHAAAVHALETEIAAARATKRATLEKFFQLGRDAELDRIAKRNADLEIQRLTEMVARHAGTTLATNP